MATITAVQNGNWLDASTWDLNRIPDINDDVYVGQYIVLNLPTNVTVKSLHNTIGYCKFTNTSTQIFNGDLFSGEGVEVLQMRQNDITLYINGNVYGSMIRTNHDTYQSSRTQTIVINGNVTLSREDILWNRPASGQFHYNSWYLTINGNITLNQNSKLFDTLLGNGNYLISLSVNGNSYFYDLASIGDLKIYQQTHKIALTFNGNVFLNSDNFLSSSILHSTRNTFTIYGDFEIVDSVGINFTNIHDAYIYGNVKYHNKYRLNSLFFVRGDVYTHDDYKCIYAGDDSPILYCISQEELHNHQQYPPENKVKEGTEYAWGELVGTYQAPPESVVLKDFVYDNDEKIGTLQFPEIDTTSIVNAIKNDPDLGGKINQIANDINNIIPPTLRERLSRVTTIEILQSILQQYFND